MEKINEIYPSGTRLYSRLIPGKVLIPGTFSQYFSSTVFSPFTNKPAASLLTLFRSERNEGMNWKACFEKVLISHSGMPLELLPARKLSLLRCTRRPCVSGNILERWHEPVGGSGNMLVSCRTSRVRSGSTGSLWREKSRREWRKPEG